MKAVWATLIVTVSCVSEDPAARQQQRVADQRRAGEEAAANEAARQQREVDVQQADVRKQGDEIRRKREADAQAAADRKKTAEHLVAECQAKLDTDLDAGLECWNEHTDAWSALGDDAALVPRCLDGEQHRAERLHDCLAKPERTDNEILGKQACLDAFHTPDPYTNPRTCAPLSVTSLDKRVAMESNYDAEKERIDRLAAPAKARVERCKSKLAAGLAVKLRADTSITASSVNGCTYSITGKVATTTRDGWAIVELSQDLAIAVKSNARYVDGALVRSDGATFVGVKAFERVDGGTATVASFKISK